MTEKKEKRSEIDGLEIYKDALRLSWEDFELPPEEILMLEGLRERFGIDIETHNKLEIEVLESLIEEREKLGIDNSTLIEYCKKALEVQSEWLKGYEYLIRYLETEKKEEEAKEYRKKLAELKEKIEVEEIGKKEELEEKVEERKTEEKAQYIIKCPKCKGDIQVDKWEFPMHIECPHCGAKGTLKKPPKGISPEGKPASTNNA